MEKQNQPDAKTIRLIAIIAVALGVLGIIKYIWAEHSQNNPIDQGNKIATPTLFMHGYGGSVNSERYFAHQAKEEGYAKETVVATVGSNGHVTLKGKIEADDKHPIVLVNLKDNKNSDMKLNALWIKNVLEALKQDYQFKQYNIVTHSMSNLSFANYMLKYGNNADLPELNKQVNIAGTFNGIIGINDEPGKVTVDDNGKPDQMTDGFLDLLNLKKVAAYEKVSILNIYGDIGDGSNSDGRVTNASSKSLKYIMNHHAKSYQEHLIKGKQGQHSQLHESKEAADRIFKFLWK
ncbi:alpha/beta hydrolase [Staphylococcus sp. IVB6181]|uniref:alpha/beta hydrolase n=1 Tax=Staphylococcus sp. IVB6181 TaxID=2929481 RepID=UPI0021D2031A|nr:alpha/beta hydrolase [Staphylococcus sp. IVB6181]UXV35711.1 alpha/beta hydrolase [Staphylococcus sp. IVB6181]